MPFNYNINTIDDYKKAEQEFQAKKAAAQLAAQTGNLDLQSKKNTYATQVLSAAAASGDQNAYNQGLQHLQQNGVDISNWAADVQTGAQQAQAARLAQSPLGSLLNAGLKQESNDIAKANLTGVLPAGGLNIGGVPIKNIVGGSAITTQPIENYTPPAAQSMPKDTYPAENVAALLPPESPSKQMPSVGGFTPPVQGGNETRQSYNDRVSQAFAQYKETPAAIRISEAAKGEAKIDVERESGKTKAESALKGFEQQSDLVIKNIDKALGAVNPFSTGYGSLLAGLPNTDARKLNNYLNTIKANVGFDKLQNMRDNSPTGGALGQVSDMENKLLQAVNGALDPAQKDQLIENLNTVKGLYPAVLEEKRRAFKQDYGSYKPIGNNEQPVQFNGLDVGQLEETYAAARAAIAKNPGAAREVQKRLIEKGLDPRKL